ncbi:MAG: DUF2203 domain-containing protein [bacterium]
MKNPKFFTVEEADKLIGLLETTLERIKRNKQEFLWLKEEIAILELIVECGADGTNPDAVDLAAKTKRFKSIAANIEKDVGALEATGCVLRDLDSGIVDFFSIQDETVIFLCWKKGEDSITHWHSIREGFAGRQPLYRSPSKR